MEDIDRPQGKHAEKRKARWQEENVNTVIKRGDYVEIGVNQMNLPTEHLWFIVEEVKGSLIKGKLNNAPIIITFLKDGDEYYFHREAIEAHIPY